MICGFCGETDEEFEETLTLLEEVEYNVAFLFPYSMREVILVKQYFHKRLLRVWFQFSLNYYLQLK